MKVYTVTWEVPVVNSSMVYGLGRAYYGRSELKRFSDKERAESFLKSMTDAAKTFRLDIYAEIKEEEID